MNRFVIAVIVVVLILTFGILNEVYINNSFKGITTRCEQVQKLLENKEYENAKELSKESIDWWQKRRNVLELTCPHNEIKDFMTNLSTLYGAIYAENYQDALSISLSLQQDAQTRLGLLKYAPKNIF